MSKKLDAAVAEAMGWALRETGFPVDFWLGVDGMATGYCDQPWPDDVVRYGDAPSMFSGKGVWCPSADTAASRTMEDWIAEQGPGQRLMYVGHLCQIIGYRYQWTNVELLWALVRATPEQRCLAFLKARGVDWREEE